MRANGNRWLYWYGKGYRDGLLNLDPSRFRVPHTYRLAYRTGWRQGRTIDTSLPRIRA